MADNVYSIFPVDYFIDLGLYQFGYEKCLASHSYGPAKRNHYLFHYVLSGSGTLYAKNSKDETIIHKIRSNQGFMIFPDQETTYIADDENPWEYVWLEFDGLRVFEELTIIGLNADNPVYRARSDNFRDIAKDEMLYIVGHKDYPPLNLIGHLYLFLDALVRSIVSSRSAKGQGLRSFYIHEAIAFIENHYQDNITIEDIAHECGLERTYFGKIFKAELGQPPQTFLTKYRMIKATDMLLNTKLSIAEIGKNIGYDNQLHFSRAFKKNFGISTMQWKKAHKNKRN